jgi:hypothetical protein
MIMTITLILTFLVAINFLLLIFSSNKIVKKKPTKLPFILRQKQITTRQLSNRLAPTGS